jgi:hypothetical protein
MQQPERSVTSDSTNLGALPARSANRCGQADQDNGDDDEISGFGSALLDRVWAVFVGGCRPMSRSSNSVSAHVRRARCQRLEGDGAGPPNVVADPHAVSDAEVIQNQRSVATAQSGELKSVMGNFIYERTAN